jgi:hypothetical protein
MTESATAVDILMEPDDTMLKHAGVDNARLRGVFPKGYSLDDGMGNAVLVRPPKLLLYNDASGKPQDIYLFLGRPPLAAFGNSTGDREMLEYTQSGGRRRLMALVLHDDGDARVRLRAGKQTGGH